MVEASVPNPDAAIAALLERGLKVIDGGVLI